MKQFDAVILTEDLPGQVIFSDVLKKGLVPAGAFGYVVDVRPDDKDFIVEFFDQGQTTAIADVRAHQLRLATEGDFAARKPSA